MNERDKWELTSSGVSVKRARSCDCTVDEREVSRGGVVTVLRADLFLSVPPQCIMVTWQGSSL